MLSRMLLRNRCEHECASCRRHLSARHRCHRGLLPETAALAKLIKLTIDVMPILPAMRNKRELVIGQRSHGYVALYRYVPEFDLGKPASSSASATTATLTATVDRSHGPTTRQPAADCKYLKLRYTLNACG